MHPHCAVFKTAASALGYTGTWKMAAGVGIAPTSRALQARAHLSMPSSEKWCVREELHLRCSPRGSGFTDRSDTTVSRLARKKSLRQDLHPHWSVPKTDASAVGLRRENGEPRQGLAPCSVAYEATASLSMLARHGLKMFGLARTRTRGLSPRRPRWLLRFSPIDWSPHEVTLLGLPIINRLLCF